MARKWIAMGCRIKPGISSAHVGKVKTLEDWIRTFWGQKGIDYFVGSTSQEIREYIRENAGYRLEIYKED